MKRLTKDQAAVISLYTGFLAGDFASMHKLAEELCGRPIWTHEFADKELFDELKELAKPLFLELCYDETTDEDL